MEALTAVPSWQEQYEALYREHFARLVRVCRLLLADPEEAQEVAQEVFLRLGRAYQEAAGVREWGRWLTRVAVNLCRDRRRAGWWHWWRLRGEVIEEAKVADHEPTPERAALSQEAGERIWKVFRRLSRRQREVIVLRHLEGCSTKEAAAALGLTVGSVKRHLFRGVQQLRKELGGDV